MSRTQRNPPIGLEHIPMFSRDNHTGVIGNCYSVLGDAWGRYRKRKLKREMASLHRNNNKKNLSEAMMDCS